jgi:cytidine deaminase
MKTLSDKELHALAVEAREKSYCPYSDISVGAALLTRSGKVYTGANIENSAYSPSVCAERVAFFSAVADGERDFVAIAVAGGRRGKKSRTTFPPCGLCRQVMAEFTSPDFRIILSEGEAVTLRELLPLSFGKDFVL